MVTRPPSLGRPTGRPGFTLLEVMLASSIAVLLLAALYVAVDIQVRHAQAGREVVEQAALSRTLLKRMSTDINSAVALADPARFRIASQASSTGGGMTGGGTTGAAATPAATATTTPTAAVAANPNTFALPLGVQGDTGQLNLYVSKVPREVYSASSMAAASNNTQPSPVSDLRRITYWLVGSGSEAKGLARQEVKIATSDDLTNLIPPNIDNEDSYLIAEEVRSLTFSYWDGTQWQDTWDSGTLGADGLTPIGPPVAIAITLGIVRGDGPNAAVKTYRHVIAINTANGTTPQPTPTQATTSP